MGDTYNVVKMANAHGGRLGNQFAANPGRRGGVGEEHRAECHVVGADRQQFERVATGEDAAHADDPETRCARATENCGQSDRFQCRSGESTRTS